MWETSTPIRRAPQLPLTGPGNVENPHPRAPTWVPHIYRRFMPVDVGNIDANSPRPPTPAYGTRERREPPSASTTLGAPYLPAFYAGRCGKHRRQYAAPPNSRLRDPGTSRTPIREHQS